MSTDQLSQRKTEIRKAAHAARKDQADKDRVSTQITNRVAELADYQAANCVMWYVDVRDEARTRHALPNALASGKRIVIPYCVDGELELFHLESMDELEIGMYKILEPRVDLREVASKRVDVRELDLILVPGDVIHHENAEDYAAVCPSKYGLEAFGALLEFIDLSKRRFRRVTLSVVHPDAYERQGLDCPVDLDECSQLADALGLPLKIRGR